MTRIVRALAVVCSSAVLALLVACEAPPAAAPTAAPAPAPAPGRLLDAASFAAAVADPRTTTVNVHVPFEGDIPGTTTSIPYDRIGASADRLPADRDAPLAVYCRTGPMSAEAVRTLADRGYTDIVELAGGMRAWTASGRPLLDHPANGG